MKKAVVLVFLLLCAITALTGCMDGNTVNIGDHNGRDSTAGAGNNNGNNSGNGNGVGNSSKH